MHKFIDTSTAFYTTGISPGEKLFRVKSGIYSNRIVAVYSDSANTIVYCHADPPYNEWSDPATITDTSANQPCTAYMDEDGNIHLLFTATSSHDLKYLRLTFNAGDWTVGTIRTVCSAGDNYYPSIVREEDGDLWAAWCYFDSDSSEYSIRVKKSVDNGVTWGSGPSDIGTALSSVSVTAGYVAISIVGSQIHAIYCANRNSLNHRQSPLSEESWSDEHLIYNSSQIDDKFSVATSRDNKIGVAFIAPTVPGACFKEFDGQNWSGLYVAEYQDNYYPALHYFENTPYIFYTRNIGDNQYAIKYCYLNEGVLTDTDYLFEGMKPFDTVFVYDDSAGNKFYDRTSEAENTAAADIYHPNSSALVQSTGDMLYVGMDSPFFYIHFILSTVGSGGTVNYAYWNGANWETFVPYSGAYHLNSSPANVLLGPDLNSVPLNWQKCTVNEIGKFWVRIKVTSTFSTPPVGSQITAIPESQYINTIANA
ncbi:MAG: hypothetical protein GF315_07055 [candidate division Zixibacteria bacterium]|nr:hypothetical protein [candidate division Zixibacteria bacterium]